jgi:RNA polymerase sigma-70 factor (ECF subfamily)
MAEKTEHKIDESLVKQFANGDMKAFDKIYSVFNQKLQKFIFTLIKTESDTEDIIQEVFVKVWENRIKLRNYTSFDSYLFTIAYNTTINLLRIRAKESQYVEFVKSVQIEVDELEFDDELNCESINEKLNLLIEKMPPRQREVFKMKHFQNYSYKEIADTLGISINTVENQMVSSHKFLKKNLGKTYLSILLFIHLFS